MFSQGHLIWIGTSALIIAGILFLCFRTKPSLKRVFSVCLPLGAVSEVVKVFSLTQIVPLVDPVIVQEGGAAALQWASTGEYTPYLAMEHLPLELCSLYLLFMLLALVLKNEAWKKRLYAVMFASGTIGGILGIVMATIAGELGSPAAFFNSARVWQYFLYHAMIVAVSLYLGFCKESGLGFSDWKTALAGIVLFDLPTFYLNSAFSDVVYLHGQVVGVTHRINFFSSYINPLGLVFTEKWQWIAYLGVRAALAVGMIVLLYSLLSCKEKS